ncbi:glucosaminidase domain-containing protein [Prevotella sp. kh1p2]|uniref:glucosaminidase domain-containing protein n=1 Tax=Prevotella sp. kh1p2 TaxID=1761883 RepID=UPI0008D21D9E|nr:glucosaminidase domain-containing protein [Prevotella sp. kh1p2]SET19067.1 Flagellum-specific peptidoglycan hydrolase FlgJ [Prevotella sp. kh1p2]SNU12204.1 Flagellum-specific peptidoglycan hydrolase FlgJ [Prevotellaceae bacterium KH2P17]
MKRYLILLLYIFTCSCFYGQIRWNQQYQAYVNQYKDLAIEEMMKYRIPASITLAQGLLESGAGLSELATKGNNHFGIKCHDWTGQTISQNDDDYGECFRAYNNAYESYEDHSRFLSQRPRYSRLFQLDRTDYRGWARGLKACGYATNPRYADKLIEIIELYRLYTYDRANSYDKFMAKRSGTDQPVWVDGQTRQLHPIRMYNKNYYLIARDGDSFKSIAEEVGIPARALARYNERDRKDVLSNGDIIYLKKKRKKAEKRYKKQLHIVKPGESMYYISQKYGMQLKYLYRKNNLSPNYQIKAGDALRVY